MISQRDDIPPAATRAPNKIKRPHLAFTFQAVQLRLKLLTWREEVAAELWGNAYYPADMFLHERLIDHIVFLAESGSLMSVGDLQRHTSWSFTGKYGEHILFLARQHIPPSLASPFVSTPLRRHMQAPPEHSPLVPMAIPNIEQPPGQALRTTKQRAPPTCRVCGQVGHRSTFTFTPDPICVP